MKTAKYFYTLVFVQLKQIKHNMLSSEFLDRRVPPPDSRLYAKLG